MKDFKKLYYMANTPWQKKNNIRQLERFSDIRQKDVIIFHYGVLYSFTKIQDVQKFRKRDYVVAVINSCLRFYNIIKKVYPHNKIYVVLHTVGIDSLTKGALRVFTDFLPGFAVYDKTKDESKETMGYFDKKGQYYHIVYGQHSMMKGLIEIANRQIWHTNQGEIKITNI